MQTAAFLASITILSSLEATFHKIRKRASTGFLQLIVRYPASHHRLCLPHQTQHLLHSRNVTSGQALHTTTKSTSALRQPPSSLVGFSNESVVRSSCTGIFINKINFSGQDVNCGAAILKSA